MPHRKVLFRVVVCCLAPLSLASAAHGQTSGFPDISQRQYRAGSAKVTVTGSATIAQDIPLNAQASYSDGEVTWLQFGESGAATPNSLITYGETKEIGIAVAKGKFIATGGIMPGEKSQCSGTVEVTDTTVAGEYTCAGVTSNEPAGKVDIKVRFTATS